MKPFPCFHFSSVAVRWRSLLLAVLWTGSLTAAERFALVIGNGTYANGANLPNPPRDASLIEKSLQGAGFKVTMQTNLGLDGMRTALEAFQAKATGAEAVVIYYAGHGMEAKGQNYLVPTDATITEEYQIPSRTLPLSEVMGALDNTRVPLKILLLDCCRNNPLGRSFRRSGGNGLAALSDTPEGTIIAYATSPGRTALDGAGANSPFAQALATSIDEAGLTVEDVIKKTIGRVKLATNKDQIPWWSGNYEGRFVLRPGSSPLPLPVPNPVAPPAERVPNSGQFTNTLGMKFVPVPGTQVQMCIHETRRADYAAYAAAASGVDDSWKNVMSSKQEPVGHEENHPVVSVSWEDAQGFCSWLSRKEGKTYRLPTDREWSVAVGIGEQEDATASPVLMDGKIKVYPWGGPFTASAIDGNYCGLETGGKYGGMIEGYRDRFSTTAPVMSFKPNALGIWDLGGNVLESCDDWYDSDKRYRVLRGSSWLSIDSANCSAACRNYARPGSRHTFIGFRVVLVVSGSGG